MGLEAQCLGDIMMEMESRATRLVQREEEAERDEKKT